MKKSIFVTLSILFLSSPFAHEFWLQPRKFLYRTGETVSIKFLVGENFEGENWSGNRQNIQELHLYYNGVEDELEECIADSTTGDSLNLQFFDEGTAMITFNSSNKFIELDPEKFQAYLEEDGLQNVIEFRKEHRETDSAGREYYQRSVKTILQVGSVKDETYEKETSLPIDIIPLNHPYLLKKNEELTIRILFNKEPLSRAVVKVWHKLKNKTEKKEYTTDQNGNFSFPVSISGQWMISTVKMIRIQDNEKAARPDNLKLKDTLQQKDTLPLQDTTITKNPLSLRDSADWQSYWGSLTWGYTK